MKIKFIQIDIMAKDVWLMKVQIMNFQMLLLGLMHYVFKIIKRIESKIR